MMTTLPVECVTPLTTVMARGCGALTPERRLLHLPSRHVASASMQRHRGHLLATSAKADTVTARRFDVAKNRYIIGRIDISDLYIAQSEKDAALLTYVEALRNS